MPRGGLSKRVNSHYNGIWAQHARPFGKSHGNRKRRRCTRQQLKKELDAN